MDMVRSHPQSVVPNATNAVFLMVYGYNQDDQTTYPIILTTTRHDGTAGFIGGKVDPGESLIDALKREVYEETSYRLEDVDVDKLKYITSHRVTRIVKRTKDNASLPIDKSGLYTHLYAINDADLLYKIVAKWASTIPNSEIPGITVDKLKDEKSWNQFLTLPFTSSVKEELYDVCRLLDWNSRFGYVCPEQFKAATQTPLVLVNVSNMSVMSGLHKESLTDGVYVTINTDKNKLGYDIFKYNHDRPHFDYVGPEPTNPCGFLEVPLRYVSGSYASSALSKNLNTAYTKLKEQIPNLKDMVIFVRDEEERDRIPEEYRTGIAWHYKQSTDFISVWMSHVRDWLCIPISESKECSVPNIDAYTDNRSLHTKVLYDEMRRHHIVEQRCFEALKLLAPQVRNRRLLSRVITELRYGGYVSKNSIAFVPTCKDLNDLLSGHRDILHIVLSKYPEGEHGTPGAYVYYKQKVWADLSNYNTVSEQDVVKAALELFSPIMKEHLETLNRSSTRDAMRLVEYHDHATRSTYKWDSDTNEWKLVYGIIEGF